MPWIRSSRSTLTYGMAQTNLKCRIGGEELRVTHIDFMGFGRGDWVPVQAEAHAEHVQLGRIDPNWFGFSDAGKKLVGSSSWTPMNEVFSPE